ncbi:hypothetical protein ACIBG0_36810 [Nocardia sp. NPDC050630]|uniref:hypothetical protein n=1 Tax=Nocardia sp. NPDC050630 TaxID=3364321 RepID=UPI0037A5C032
MTSAETSTSETGSAATQLVPCRFSWDELDSHDARDLWKELIEWVNWLRATYQTDTKIKPCWYRHRPAREELTALMVSHKAVYRTDPESAETYREDLTAWHTQWLRSSLDALARMMADCTRDGCAHVKPQAIVVDPEMDQFVTDDVGRRSNTGAPASGSAVGSR